MSDAPERTATRTLLIGGLALVAVAALVAFVVLPLLTGDEPVDEVAGGGPAVVDPQPDPTPSPTQEPVGPDEQAQPPVETFEVFTARDPFQQLVGDGPGDAGTGGTTTPPPADGTTPGPPTDGTDGTTTGPPTDGTGGTAPPPDDGTGSTDGGSAAPPPTGGNTGGNNGGDGSATVGGTTVTVVDVFTDDEDRRRSTITVNGTGYTVGEGQTFAQRFRLLDISGSCATMLFGDSRFTLCEGERIRK